MQEKKEFKLFQLVINILSIYSIAIHYLNRCSCFWRSVKNWL